MRCYGMSRVHAADAAEIILLLRVPPHRKRDIYAPRAPEAFTAYIKAELAKNAKMVGDALLRRE